MSKIKVTNKAIFQKKCSKVFFEKYRLLMVIFFRVYNLDIETALPFC